MGKVIDFTDYFYKKQLSKIKLTKNEIMHAKRTLLGDDDYSLYEDIKKDAPEELKEM